MKTNNQEIKLLINDLSLSAQNAFGDRCTAVYIMGSLARGGFSEAASDIDIGIILNGMPRKDDSSTIRKIQADSRNNYPQIKCNVSIFWGSIESINGVVDAGRYPPFDRLDLIDHAELISGTDIRHKLVKPSQKELVIASADFAVDYLGSKERVNEFLNCALIASKGTVYVTKTVLFPTRFIYLERTGEVAGNDASHQYYLDNFIGDDAELVRSGYQWRLNSLPNERDSVIEKLDKGLIELYRNFIDIYVESMESYGQHELKSKLMEWKQDISSKSTVLGTISYPAD